MMIKLLSSIKLPYEVTRGTVAKRSKKAADFVDRLNKETVAIINEGTINQSKFQNVLNKLLPENIRVLVLKNKDIHNSAANDLKLNNQWQITDLTMELDFKQNELAKEKIIDILHEGRHIADSLFNPKYLARQQTLEQRGLYTGKFLNFYEKQLYIIEYAETKNEIKDTLKIIKNKLHNVLRGYSTEDKVNILQDLRYGLETEKNAFKTQNKYGKDYRKAGFKIEEGYDIDGEEYLFDEKIKFLKQTAFDIIQNARKVHTRKLKQKKKFN